MRYTQEMRTDVGEGAHPVVDQGPVCDLRMAVDQGRWDVDRVDADVLAVLDTVSADAAETPGRVLRIRRLGVRVPPSALHLTCENASATARRPWCRPYRNPYSCRDDDEL